MQNNEEKIAERRVALEPLLTTQEVCAILRICPAKLGQMLKHHKMYGSKIGRTWRFTKDDILDVIRRGRNVT